VPLLVACRLFDRSLPNIKLYRASLQDSRISLFVLLARNNDYCCKAGQEPTHYIHYTTLQTFIVPGSHINRTTVHDNVSRWDKSKIKLTLNKTTFCVGVILKTSRNTSDFSTTAGLLSLPAWNSLLGPVRNPSVNEAVSGRAVRRRRRRRPNIGVAPAPFVWRVHVTLYTSYMLPDFCNAVYNESSTLTKSSKNDAGVFCNSLWYSNETQRRKSKSVFVDNFVKMKADAKSFV